MLVYLKNALFDFLLCVAVSTALSYTLLSGFYSTQSFQDTAGIFMTLGACVAMLAALFLVSSNRKLTLIGGIAMTLIALAIFAVATATSTVENPMDDQVGNNLYLAMCLILPPLGTFELSRTKPGCLILIVVGVVLCAVIEYLYWYGHLVAFLVFFIGAAALYVYRTYQVSLLNSETENLAFASVTVAGVVLSLLAVGVGLAVFTCVVAPLDPPNLVIKLITEHYRAEEKEVRGIGSTDDVQDEEDSTEQNEETTQSSELSEEEDEDQQADGDSALGLNPLAAIGAGIASLTMNFPQWWPFAAVFIVIALVASAIGLKKYLRKRRFEKMTAPGGNEAVSALYLFFLDRFTRFKIPSPGTLTLQEYADGFSEMFKKFEQRVDEPDFSDLTRVYMRQAYGGDDVTEDELSAFKDYYGRFYKRACKYIGKLKYGRLFFRI